MRDDYDFDPKPEHKLTCKDFRHTGVECCENCHDPGLAEYELRVVKVDGVNALLCCCMVAFFYPRDPTKGMTPEEKLLVAIFGEKAVHPPAEKYIDPAILEPDYEDYD